MCCYSDEPKVAADMLDRVFLQDATGSDHSQILVASPGFRIELYFRRLWFGTPAMLVSARFYLLIPNFRVVAAATAVVEPASGCTSGPGSGG